MPETIQVNKEDSVNVIVSKNEVLPLYRESINLNVYSGATTNDYGIGFGARANYFSPFRVTFGFSYTLFINAYALLTANSISQPSIELGYAIPSAPFVVRPYMMVGSSRINLEVLLFNLNEHPDRFQSYRTLTPGIELIVPIFDSEGQFSFDIRYNYIPELPTFRAFIFLFNVGVSL
ncbi:MAG: hypothetical protein SFU91_13535 [Chloroherpetonaceae bacterium]|nr:hypothetical protein [Chloroherpetonaceae bacterium]